MRTKLYILTFFALWILFQYVTSAHVYWRDSGEFIVSAFYLDVAHPAGFPFYSQAANAFALLPFGPIAWRVNLFSSFCSSLSLIMLYALSRRIFLCRVTNLNASLLALIPPLAFAFIPTMLKQAGTAEVYPLLCFNTLLLIFLWDRYQKTDDVRFLYVGAFLSGLSLGNHVAIIFALFFIFVAAFASSRKAALLLPVCFWGLFGLGVIAYIPLRASQPLPLNTGQANSPSRLINLLTDARDRALRAPIQTTSTSQEPGAAERLMQTLKEDLSKLANEFSPAALVLAPLGLVLLFRRERLIAIIILGTILLNWYFFRGWNPDPWGVIFALTCLLCVYPITACLSALKNSGAQQTIASLLVMTLCVILVKKPSSELRKLRTFQMARDSGRELLNDAAPRSILLTEDSWFLTQYLNSIEGYREDITPIYTQDILRPEYFRNTHLTSDPATHFEINQDSPSDRLKLFLDFAAPKTSIELEPNISLNTYLYPLIQLEADGSFSLEYGKQGKIQQSHLQEKIVSFNRKSDQIKKTWDVFRWESSHQLGVSLNNEVDLLKRLNAAQDAMRLVENVCLPVSTTTCPTPPLNNLALAYLEGDDPERAARLLLELLSWAHSDSRALETNLRNAWIKLSPDIQAALVSNPSVAKIIEHLAFLSEQPA